jgi:hypothetical protein
MINSRRRRTATFAVLAALGVLYPLLRRPILTWDATSEEAASHLPGDELLEDADGVSTRAITIDRPAASVWPWLAQMGPSPRGGAYTYDLKLVARIGMLPMEPGSLLMERRMLRSIKDRAERLASGAIEPT